MFSGLHHVALLDFWCVGKVFCDILFGEQGPANDVAGFDSLEPRGFDGITAYCMHPSDCLFNGW